MPISLPLEEDLLAALRARSEAEGRPVEAVLADLVRRGLADRPLSPPAPVEPEWRGDILVFPARPDEPPVTHALIRRLMDEAE